MIYINIGYFLLYTKCKVKLLNVSLADISYALQTKGDISLVF